MSVCGYGTDIRCYIFCLWLHDRFVSNISNLHPLQVWNLTNCRLKINHSGHTGYLNTVTVSPDGSLCASGGKVRIYNTYYIYLSKHNDHANHIDSVCRTAKLCYGIWMTGNISTLWITMTSSQRYASALIVIGCAPRLDPGSKSGISRLKRWSKNWNPKSFLQRVKQSLRFVCLSRGPPTARRCSLDIPITLFVYGKFLCLADKLDRLCNKNFKSTLNYNLCLVIYN